ncbi:SRPBCC family protein [Roseibium aggregatum]|uniref:SRPBCC family protein n=1 Tax=Roseibium aggregatum TaxID=187304 RepID=A0A939EGW0_9HYPH|nr:SRPBCC family protein [Roseibium aggregatum]MBN9672905.1 SRPBCC family protein [Roseibium aggregatum]
MKTHDVQSVSIGKPARTVFDFVSNPANLPVWTNAFKSADAGTAELVTPNGAVPIRLETSAYGEQGTVDWKMTFPDGSVGTAFSRITPDGEDKSIYSFVLMAPPVPLEALEGALKEQMTILAGELAELKRRLEA